MGVGGGTSSARVAPTVGPGGACRPPPSPPFPDRKERWATVDDPRIQHRGFDGGGWAWTFVRPVARAEGGEYGMGAGVSRTRAPSSPFAVGRPALPDVRLSSESSRGELAFLWAPPAEGVWPVDAKRRHRPALATTSHGCQAASEGRPAGVGIGLRGLPAVVASFVCGCPMLEEGAVRGRETVTTLPRHC